MVRQVLFHLAGGLVLGRHVDHPRTAGDLRLRLAVAHAGLRVPEALFRGLAVVLEEASGIGHLHLGERVLRQHEFVVDHIVEVEDVSDHRVKLVIGQRLRVAERHGATDIIEHGRGAAEIGAHCLHRIGRRDRAGTAGELRPAAGAFAELAMAGRAFRHVNLFALLHRALPGRRALPIRTNVDVPSGDLLHGRGLADVEACVRFRSLRFRGRLRGLRQNRRCEHQQRGHSGRRNRDDPESRDKRKCRWIPGSPAAQAPRNDEREGRNDGESVTTLRHSRPRRPASPHKSECRCCDRWN